MKSFKYDFSGWATRNDLKCSDGRTIRHNAFKDNDGMTVPLVWNHQHNDPLNVLGHALLENRDEGVYAYCALNDTETANEVRKIVQHGDVDALSIYANKLVQKGGDVLHGAIREVSLVLSGANPGAHIDSVLTHGDEEGDCMIYWYVGDDGLSFMHGEEGGDGDSDSDSDDSYDEDDVDDEEDEDDADDDEEDEDDEMGLEEAQKIYEGLSDEEQNAVNYIVGEVLERAGLLDDDDDEGDDDAVKHNVFEEQDDIMNNNYLSHSDMEEIFKDAKRLGSLREAVMNFTDDAGIELMHSTYSGDTSEDHAPGYDPSFGLANLDYLFPDYKSLNTPPDFIQRNMDWVTKVMGGVHHTPFSRIKSMFANITADEARAKGYLKGNRKTEEIFSLLKRTTDPQTVYKKQKLDRDDIIDITDFDVVAWIRKEMRMMLDEEIARAILIGDGRLAADDDHISHDHVRPVATDDPLYTIKVQVADDDPAEMIKSIIRARKNYKGSGNPTFFTTEDVLTEMLLLEDGIGHALYKTEAELATKLRVRDIVTVPVMENQTIDGDPLYGVIVNLTDYNVGADKGGAISMFDDFDIDYNQQKYLIETRISGALTKPYSAMVVLGGLEVSNG